MGKRTGRPVSDLANRLGLTDAEMSDVVSAHEKRGETRIVESLFLLYSRLVNKVGRDPSTIGKWLRSSNDHLNDEPLSLIKTSSGFGQVVDYLGTVA